MASGSGVNSVLWFRKGLRLHDNPALLEAARGATHLFPVFVLDPWFLRPDPAAPTLGSTRVGVNRIRFLLECLHDLDRSLRARGSRLVLAQGNPVEVLPALFKDWGVSRLCFEFDTEPYARARDEAVAEAARAAGVEVCCPVSHTLFDPRHIIQRNGGKAPLTYQSFCKLLGTAPKPVGDAPGTLPPVGPEAVAGPHLGDSGSRSNSTQGYTLLDSIPTLGSLGYAEAELAAESVPAVLPPFRGGETEGLQRMEQMLSRTQWVAKFEKPKGDPSAFLTPATTVLSPYLKFGCVSARVMYHGIQAAYRQAGAHTQPPVSLEGQLLWREFFYTVSFGTSNFERMVGNPICKQVPWQEDEALLARWRDGQTGFPWIDAIMVQLREWGWMHHLARHCVACFLTRGDLFLHWEKGRDVFDRLLLDADWAINNGNWLWLSASAFFAQYFRIYSPTTFGKKYDPSGKFVRHFLPVLKDMPDKYIYEPWTAPVAVQQKAKCIIGKDYPFPVVDHGVASKLCKDRMALAYASSKGSEAARLPEPQGTPGRYAELGTGARGVATRKGAKGSEGPGRSTEEKRGHGRKPGTNSRGAAGTNSSPGKGNSGGTKKRQKTLLDLGE